LGAKEIEGKSGLIVPGDLNLFGHVREKRGKGPVRYGKAIGEKKKKGTSGA